LGNLKELAIKTFQQSVYLSEKIVLRFIDLKEEFFFVKKFSWKNSKKLFFEKKIRRPIHIEKGFERNCG